MTKQKHFYQAETRTSVRKIPLVPSMARCAPITAQGRAGRGAQCVA